MLRSTPPPQIHGLTDCFDAQNSLFQRHVRNLFDLFNSILSSGDALIRCRNWQLHRQGVQALSTVRHFTYDCHAFRWPISPILFCCTSTKSIQMSVTWQVLNISNVNRGQQNNHQYRSDISSVLLVCIEYKFLIPFKFRWVCAIFSPINLVIHLMLQRLLPPLFLANVICTTERE